MSLQLIDWSSIYGAQISSKKTKEILFSLDRYNLTDSSNATPSVIVNNTNIERVYSCRLLGLHIDNNLPWQTHVETIISKCNTCLSFLCRLKRAGYKTAELKLYFTACVRSVLEYGCQLWSISLTECQISALEDISKRACRIITGISQLDYLMQSLNLEPLARRRDDIAK